MESSVTRLLVGTKMLLEALTEWSHGRQTETNVSEIYVRLGNDFNVAITAFTSYGIDMSDLYSIPSDLRSCLETCLSEPASPAALEQYLPRIREIIIRLLQGLKVKQANYKQLALRQRSEQERKDAKTKERSQPTAAQAISDAAQLPLGPRSMGAVPLPTPPQQAPPATVPSALAQEETETDNVTMRALRSREALERRASKRFSAYTMTKMHVPGFWGGPGTSPRSSYGDRAMHHRNASAGVHPISDAPSEADDSHTTLVRIPSDASSTQGLGISTPTSRDRGHCSAPLPDPAVERDAPFKALAAVPEASPNMSSSFAPSPAMDVFVQLGRHTRKVQLPVDPSAPKRGLSVAALRMLFVDQFAYSPGMEDFPEIYTKDPATGIQYQLDDLDDVQARALLTLNIEPLDQVKQHVDLSLANVTRELRELKQMLRETEGGRAAADSAKAIPISDSDFLAAGDRMSNYVATPQLNAEPVHDGDGDGNANPAGVHLANELKKQYDELQKLRNDFAILRQVHGNAETDMRDVFARIRAQVKEFEEANNAGPSVGRSMIETGKCKLHPQSQEALTTVEDLQDLIEDLKLDVSQRGVKPKPSELKRIAEDIGTATQRLDELEQYVQNIKPHWKKAWETELQNIVDEQEFLNYQEGLLADLKQDHIALQDVFANIQQVVRLRDVNNRPHSPTAVARFVPPPPHKEHQGIGTVMIEVRGQAIDHERRLRAVQAAEKSREKVKVEHADEFSSELAGFVDGKQLRMTGGHRETDRVRQKRDQNTLRSMLTGGQELSSDVP
ncbi:Bud site selection protein 6 [Malassezia vespertilionis]|nr:Bud site selection protein 6 [Malassezia vespertilionis]WFD06174.1 Bud site selection protein 6 [Malassezia vespertilionis]